VKTTRIKYSLKAGTRGEKCKVNFSWVKIVILAKREKIPKVNTVVVHVVGGSQSGISYKVGRGGACTKKTPPAQYFLNLCGEFKLQPLSEQFS
jgi:hypothetical protein